MFPEGRALEFLLAAVVALVVVGPKDLPILMRKLGQFMGKMRAMAAEFRASFDEMARQSELDELRKEVEAMRRAQFADVAAQAGGAEMKDAFDDVRESLDPQNFDPQIGASQIGASQNVASQNVNDGMAPDYPEAVVAPEPQPKPRARRKPAAPAAAPTAADAPAKPRPRKKAEPKA